MANLISYQFSVGATDYPARYNAFVSTMEGYATRVEALEAGWTLDVNAGAKRLTNLGAPTQPNDAATRAYADALAFTANAGILPGQGGQNGKFLRTNGTVASWALAGLVGANQFTVDAAPADAANAVQWSNATTDGQVITLPSATGLANGLQFIVANGNSTGAMGVFYNTGEMLTALAANKAALLILLDNSTAAGKWRVIDDINAVSLANYTGLRGPFSSFTAAASASATRWDMCQMAADSFVMAYRGSTAGIKLRAITVSGRTVTMGAEYSVGSITPNRVRIVKCNTGSFLAFGSDSSTLAYCPCSVSGTTITTGTAVNQSTTLSSAQGAPGFDVDAPPTAGGVGCCAYLESVGLRALGFSMGVSATSLTFGTTSANVAVTAGGGVAAVRVALATSTLASIWFTDTYSAGSGALKVVKVTALTTSPAIGTPVTVVASPNYTIAATPDADQTGLVVSQGAIPSTDKVLFAFNSINSGLSFALFIWDASAGSLGTSSATTLVDVRAIVAESATKAIVAGNGNSAATPICKLCTVALAGNTISSQTVSAQVLDSGYTTSQAAGGLALWAVDTNLYAFAAQQNTASNAARRLDLLLYDTSGAAPVVKQRNGGPGAEITVAPLAATTNVAGGSPRSGYMPNAAYRAMHAYQDGTSVFVSTLNISKMVS